MREEEQRTREQTFLRIGAVCAILGAIVSVAAGTGFGNLTNEASTEAVLRTIASRPDWYWPAVHLGFIVGALLWVGAFIALASSLWHGTGRALGWLGAASVIVGATIHVVDSSISGFGLTALADAWATAPTSEQANLLRAADTLLMVLGGTWTSVISFFHGVPFVLFGLAVVLDRRYPLARRDRCRRRLGLAGGRDDDVPRRGPRPGVAVHRVRPRREPVYASHGCPDVASLGRDPDRHAHRSAS